MTRYLPARHYVTFGITALALGMLFGWLGITWPRTALPIPAISQAASPRRTMMEHLSESWGKDAPVA